MRGRYAALSILALVAGVSGGVALERLYLGASGDGGATGPEILYWVAPMDPNFRRDQPGKSPMGMDLIPVYAGEEPPEDPSEVVLSPAEINAIGVRTALARIEEIAPRIETVGFVGYNEHLTSHVHTRVSGWIESLNVRAVGDRVQRGQVLFEVFSPEFATAGFDVVRALEGKGLLSREAARNKLRSHGATEKQIAEIEATRQAPRNIRVEAPRSGVVVSLAAADGMYLQPATQAVSIADLSSVWLIVDVFERDVARLTGSMRAIARFEHLPGRTFEGEIDYIYPELDSKTRTLPVRLRFDNAEGLLRPGMFGTVSLVPEGARQALTVPSEAVIRTGSGERVILKTAEGTFKPRLVTTGLRGDFGNGSRTEILQGLNIGEEVVASAQFLIDSESALGAGTMRMAPSEAAPVRGSGELVDLDADRRAATIRHPALEGLGWPAMTSEFPVRASIQLDHLAPGMEVAFRIARGADGQLGLLELGPNDGIAATGTGMATAVTGDGKLTLEHDPIPDLGWPAMTMDLEVSGIDPHQVPLQTPIEFDLSKDDAGMFRIVAVRNGAVAVSGDRPAVNAAAAPIRVEGTVEAIDLDQRRATIAHGSIREIGMPGMTMVFDVDPDFEIGTLPVGQKIMLTFSRPDGMTMVLTGYEDIGSPETSASQPPMRVTGRIDAVHAGERKATITHGPMVEIGMPGMTMDFAIAASVDPASLPKETEVMLLLQRNPDFTLTLVGVEAAQ